MKKLIPNIICLILINWSVLGFSQTLTIPFSKAPTINGKIDSAEWSNADTATIKINNSRSTKVYYMYDTAALYLAFIENLQSGGNYFPEVVIDPNNDTNSTFQSDDWWFHVSATDCESKGQYGNYANCKKVQNDWTAVPNFAPRGSVVDTVEMEIKFSKIGVNLTDTIGIAFVLNNFVNFKNFPSTADHLNPSTWQNATFDRTTKIEDISSIKENTFELYPNPSNGIVSLSFNQLTGSKNLEVYDQSGRLLINNVIGERNNSNRIDLSQFDHGLYFIKVITPEISITKKLILTD